MNINVLEKHHIVFKEKNKVRHAQGVSHFVHNVGMNLDMPKGYLVVFTIK